jgi:hypothetical protein
MTDTARVLLTAALLTGSALATFVTRIVRIDPAQPERLVGELWLAQWAALLLAAVGAMPIGACLVSRAAATGQIDAALGIGFIVLAAVVLRRAPRDALLLCAAGFVAHALVDIAHRPGLLSPDLLPRWYTVGCASFNVFVAAVCFLPRLR